MRIINEEHKTTASVVLLLQVITPLLDNNT